jgi:hypothetical protein
MVSGFTELNGGRSLGPDPQTETRILIWLLYRFVKKIEDRECYSHLHTVIRTSAKYTLEMDFVC